MVVISGICCSEGKLINAFGVVMMTVMLMVVVVAMLMLMVMVMLSDGDDALRLLFFISLLP